MKDWHNTLVSPETSIRQAIETITNSTLQVALVVDRENRLKGIITDGDVRRGILRNIAMTETVDKIMETNFTSVTAADSREAILEQMQLRDLRHIPVVDGEGHVLDLKFLPLMLEPPSLNNMVVIMAGGQGSRLRPITEDQPKPLLKVGDKPLMETIINNFKEFGLSNFFVSLNYKATMIENYFGDGSKWGVSITYLRETDRLGTAGALSLLPERPRAPVFVMNGDLLTKINLKHLLDFHVENRSAATMCVRQYDFQVPYGVVKAEGQRLLSFKEKPVHCFFVNAGIYVLEPETLELVPKNRPFDMTTLFENLLEQGRNTTVFPIHEYWLDIGRSGDYEQANGDYHIHFK